ncbi:MAG TPA: hypothetical protein VEB21_15895, partial [Terriglobales bacterium]|nr:hypothetical protein [Terriglobales bacterium]
MSYVQVVLLIFGFLGASVLIFLFGFAVGQDMALRQTQQSEQVTRAPVPPRQPTTPAVPGGGVDASFYKELQEKAEKRLAATAEPAAAETTAPVAAPPSATPTALKPTATRRKTEAPRPTATRRATPPRPPS